MTEQPADWRDGMTRSVVDEVEHVIGAFAARNEDEPDDPIRIGVARKGDELDYLYAEGQILVQDRYLGRVLEFLGLQDELTLRQDERQSIRPVIAGVALLMLPPPGEGQRRFLVPDVLESIDASFGPGVATPDHVLTVAGGTPAICPATEPEEVYVDAEPFPPACHDNGGGSALVYVSDTGLLRHAGLDHPWLSGVRVENPATDYDAYLPPAPGRAAVPPIIPPYTGHGTFVAGVLRSMAPAADVVVAKISLAAGSTVQSRLVMKLTAALGLAPDVFNITLACTSRLDVPLLGFPEWLRLLRNYGAVCIAPAGNSGIRRPSWPAAFADVVAVGALGGDWRGRASFSNFGSWVDVYAPGRDLVNAYTTGTYQCQVSPYRGTNRNFYGMAKWSGTSFSTPIVSGLIAARMSATGENARVASAALLAQARAEAVPGVGPVLLPRCRDTWPCACSCHRSCCGCGDRRLPN